MPSGLTLLSVVGARPQFVKLAPVGRALNATGRITHLVLHTGQHYDRNMSDSFFKQLSIPAPDINLEIGSASHAVQTGEMMRAIEHYLGERDVDAVLTYGDTNSTLAATLAAAKIHTPVAHIEAGLRSFNRSMPEEINRLVADHCSDRLYAPTPLAMENLNRENLQGRAVRTGDVMLDAVLHNSRLADGANRVAGSLGLAEKGFGLVTIHRPSNTSAAALSQLITELERIATQCLPLLFPVHPRTRKVLDGLDRPRQSNLLLVDPLSYLESIAATRAAALVITDSGGVQKEAAFLKTPCITVREETEWQETVDLGVNRLVGAGNGQLLAAVEDLLSSPNPFDAATLEALKEYYGTGDASDRIAADLLDWLSEIPSRKLAD